MYRKQQEEPVDAPFHSKGADPKLVMPLVGRRLTAEEVAVQRKWTGAEAQWGEGREIRDGHSKRRPVGAPGDSAIAGGAGNAGGQAANNIGGTLGAAIVQRRIDQPAGDWRSGGGRKRAGRREEMSRVVLNLNEFAYTNEGEANEDEAGLYQAGNSILAPRKPHFAAKAERAVFLFMKGGASEADTLDQELELRKRNGQM